MEFIENDYFSKMPSRSKSRWAAPALSNFDGLESVPSQVVPDKDNTDGKVIKTDDGLPKIVDLNTGPNDDPNNLTINENEDEDGNSIRPSKVIPDMPGPDDPRTMGFTGTQKWVWQPVAGTWGIGGVAGAGKKTPEQIEQERILKAETAEKNRLLAKNQTLEAANKRSVESATAILTKFVNLFGLPLSVVQKLKSFMTAGLTDDEIELEIQGTEEYKARFPGMATRLANGFGSMTPVEYIEFEDGQKELMRINGMPAKFYDEPEDFTTFIGQDISLSEVSSRVDMARLATQGADANTKAELKRLFGVNDDDLVAYYLDPKKAINLFEEKRSLEAAGLSATAMSSLNTTVGFDKKVAEDLQRSSVQGREIQQRLNPLAGLTEATLNEKSGLTSSELAKSEFGLSVEAKNNVRRTREQRVTNFAGTGGMLTSGTGVSGLGTAT